MVRPSVHFLKFQGKFFFVISMYPFLLILTSKIMDETLKKSPGSLHFTLLSNTQYLNNYLGQLINLKHHIRNI